MENTNTDSCSLFSLVNRLWIVWLGLMLALGPMPAYSQDKPYWELGLGFTVFSFADYLGSDNQNVWLLPFPYVIYKSETVNVDRNVVYGNLWDSERFRLKLSLSGSIPVDSEDNEARRGMPDLDPILEVGPALEYTIYENRSHEERFILKIPVRSAIASDFTEIDHVGWITDPSLRYERERPGKRKRWQMDMELGPLFGNGKYHDYFFGVDPQFATEQRPAFSAAGGFGGWRFSIGFSRRIETLWYGAFFRYFALENAEYIDSPLIEQEDSFITGFAVAWIFADSQ